MVRTALTSFVLTAILLAQQPNSPVASMTIDAALGPPYPIAVSVATATTAVFALYGAAGAPFIIALSATGVTQPGSLPTPGGIVDLPLSPPPTIALDGSANPQFVLDPSGAFNFGVAVPAGIPLGHHEAAQAAIADASSPAGFTVTAATDVTVVQGPIVVQLSLGSDGVALIDLASYGMTIPFFGSNYTQAWVCANGFITFGQPDSSFIAAPAVFNSGPPRLAPFWTDLDQVSGGVIRYTVDQSPLGGGPPAVLVEWIGVTTWAMSITHTFSASFNGTGVCSIHNSVASNSSVYSTVVGIGPGGNLNQQSSKDLSVLDLGGGASGAVNESFFEYFVTSGTWPPAVINPFDLYGLTLDFVPIAPGSLPASTLAYALN
jgi:hypothetical protein